MWYSVSNKSKRKKAALYLLSYVLPLLIIVAAFVALQIAPFGDVTLVISDADAQYINYYSFLGRLFRGNGNIFYSFSKALGGNMIGQVGLPVNPFFWLFAFAQYETLPIVFSVICILNTALSGLTMFAFLKKVFGTKSSHLVFSTAYSLCGYAVVNNFQLPWIMYVSMLPLVALGIYKIVHNESSLCYFVSLAYTILDGYYLGYMICIFSVCFFLMLFLVERSGGEKNLKDKSNSKIIVRYIVTSLCAGLVSSFVWIPSLLSVIEGRFTQIGYEDYLFEENMPFLEMGAKLFSGANSTSELISGLPNIFCTLFVVALTILYFIDKEQNKRKKTGYACILGVYLLSFYLKPLTAVFHMLSQTNWFNYRYSFVFSFLLILIAVEEFERINEINKKDIIKALGILAILTILVFNKKYEFVSGSMALVDWLILFVMIGAILFSRKNPEKSSYNTLVALLCVCISINLYVNYYFSVKGVNVDGWKKSYTEFCSDVLVRGSLAEAISTYDPGLYRMENEDQRTGECGNDAMMFDYYGTGAFTSNERAYITHGISRFGINWFDMRNSYDSGTPATMDSFLGLKYIISKNDLERIKNYSRKAGIEDSSIYTNPFVLDFSILSDSDFDGIDIYSMNIFELQNTIWKKITSMDKNIFSSVSDVEYTTHNLQDNREYVTDGNKMDLNWEVVESDDDKEETNSQYYIEYSFTAAKQQPIYIYIGGFIDKNSGTNLDSLRCLGIHKPGEIVTGRIDFDAPLSQKGLEEFCNHNCIYYEDLDALAELSGIVQSRNNLIQMDAENKLSGSFETDEEKTLLFTIPYDDGWTLKVDGVKAEYDKTLGIFMSYQTNAGRHEWTLEFIPVGFKLGCIISSVALIAWICYYAIDKRRKKVITDDTI